MIEKFRCATVGMVILFFAALVGITFFAIQWGDSNPWARYSEEGRARRVLANAFTVAHPGYNVDFFMLDDDDFDIKSERGVFSMKVSTRSPYLRFTQQWQPFPVTLEFLSSMKLKSPHLEETLTARAIDDIESGRKGSKEATRDLLQSLRPPLLATAVVGFDAPVTEEAFKGVLEGRLDAIVLGYSGEGKMNTLTWSGGICDATEFNCGSTDGSRLREFQWWVGGLEDGDNDALGAFGLNLHRLRKHAADSVIQGVVVTASPKNLQKIIDDSRVRWLRVVDVFIDR